MNSACNAANDYEERRCRRTQGMALVKVAGKTKSGKAQFGKCSHPGKAGILLLRRRVVRAQPCRGLRRFKLSPVLKLETMPDPATWLSAADFGRDRRRIVADKLWID
jgi:hypothetical protein